MITIPEFYSNRDIFITGGSGFVGKVLIEKLLRSCSGLRTIYILLRTKRSKTVKDRLEEIKELPLFSTLMESSPKVFNKLVPIEGDVTDDDLGLTDESRALLKDVSVIFHSAASVRFDENYKTAIILNTKGTHEVIKFALTLKSLVSFVHVSTTYCYPDHQFIDEKLYPVAGEWQQTVRIVEKTDDELLECFMPIYNNFKPNSYVYAKALSEHVCESYKNQLPITIVRPSIVVGTEVEPIPGWCDNFNGPVGLLTACGLGIMRTMYASNKALLNCVAVDVVGKTLIVAGWKTAIDNGIQSAVTLGESAKVEVNENCGQLQVYNCASTHNMDLELLVYDGQYSIRKYPFDKCVYLPGGGVTLCKVMNYFRIVCFQLVPAALIDHALKLKGRKPMLMLLQRKIAAASVALHDFVFTKWRFGTDNFKSLQKVILDEDLEDFSLERKVKNSREYYEIQILGARRYLMKEPDSSIPACRRRIYLLLIFDIFFRILLFGYIFYLLGKKINLFDNKIPFFEFRNDTITERI